MFHPVGSHPPSVYWRRRFVFAAMLVILLVLLVLTVRAVTSGAAGPAPAAAAGSNAGPQHPGHQVAGVQTSRSAPSNDPPSSSPTGSSSSANSFQPSNRVSRHLGRAARRSRAAASSSTAPPPQCTSSQLSVQAVAGQTTYQVGQKPVVEMQVTNTGSGPCVQDLADRQIVLKVYNGESRVWGSHDCEVQPGTDDRMLAVGRPVRVSVTWSGLTSEPGCQGTRRRVGAGTYTLYASLGGHQGKATQFSIV
jgi:hypothetical protein